MPQPMINTDKDVDRIAIVSGWGVSRGMILNIINFRTRDKNNAGLSDIGLQCHYFM